MTGQCTVIFPEVVVALPAASDIVTVQGTTPEFANGPRVARHIPRTRVIGALPGAPAGSVQLRVADTTPTLSVPDAATWVVVGLPQFSA